MKLRVLTICLFSKAIEVLANILYTRGSEGKKPTLYSFDEFQTVMEVEDVKLKMFFDELYIFHLTLLQKIRIHRNE